MSESPSEKASNDRALRFYRDVLGLERLHYGIWNPDDELTFACLKDAQKRYEDFLVRHIPEGAVRVLDVGCGTGEMCLTLKSLGYEIEGLSPDRNQKKVFAEKLKAPFHHSRFEDFTPEENTYDCIIMSESCQYIPMEKLFEIAKVALKPGGRLLVCDYFVTDHDQGILSKSGHCYETFLTRANASAFEIVKQQDITEETAMTLDMGKLLAERFLLGFDILTERFREKNPRIFKVVKWFFRKKVASVQEQMVLLDSERFAEVKRYEFFEFKSVKAASAGSADASLGAA